MRRFFSGKIKKELFALILFWIPMIVFGMFFTCDYGAGALISIVLITLFINWINKEAAHFQVNQIFRTRISICILLISFGMLVQVPLFALSYQSGNLFVKENWNSFENLIKPVLIAPIVEEIVFRWASVVICIDKNSTKINRILFLVVMSILWTLAHGLNTINLGVTLVGLLLYFIYFKTENIIYCIMFHLSVNLSYAIMFSPFQYKMDIVFRNNVFIYLICFAIIIEFVCLIIKLKSAKREKPGL